MNLGYDVLSSVAEVLRLSSLDVHRLWMYKHSSYRRRRRVAGSSGAAADDVDDSEAEKNSDVGVQRHALRHSNGLPAKHVCPQTTGNIQARRRLRVHPTSCNDADPEAQR